MVHICIGLGCYEGVVYEGLSWTLDFTNVQVYHYIRQLGILI